MVSVRTACKPDPQETKADKCTRLRLALLQKPGQKLDPNSLVFGDADRLRVGLMSTGIPQLDDILYGGLPDDRIIELFGPSQSGKTTLALHLIGNVQKAGGNATLIDAEHRFDPAYAQSLGVDVSTLLIAQPECGEVAFDIVCKLIKSEKMNIIVVDSAAALKPRAVLRDEVNDEQHSAMMSHGLQLMTAEMNNAKSSKCLIVFINQIRHKSVVYGNPEITPGGIPLLHYASVRLDMRRTRILKRGQNNYGIETKVQVAKSSVAVPHRSTELEIIFGKGIQAIEVSP